MKSVDKLWETLSFKEKACDLHIIVPSILFFKVPTRFLPTEDKDFNVLQSTFLKCWRCEKSVAGMPVVAGFRCMLKKIPMEDSKRKPCFTYVGAVNTVSICFDCRTRKSIISGITCSFETIHVLSQRLQNYADELAADLLYVDLQTTEFMDAMLDILTFEHKEVLQNFASQKIGCNMCSNKTKQCITCKCGLFKFCSAKCEKASVKKHDSACKFVQATTTILCTAEKIVLHEKIGLTEEQGKLIRALKPLKCKLTSIDDKKALDALFLMERDYATIMDHVKPFLLVLGQSVKEWPEKYQKIFEVLNEMAKL